MSLTATPKVALSKDFLESLARLPKKIQKKAREFTEKFQRDPTQPGLNFERINARDPKVRSVRIDQAYRVIVIHPPKGDVYVCVWVDHHDDAYRWAQNRVFEVNPTSGVFQLYDFDAVTLAEPESALVRKQTLFADVDEEDLLLAGVPSPLLPAVQSLKSDADLDALAPHLPEDAAEMLYYLASGFSLIDALEESERSKYATETVDTEDFAVSLAQPQSQRVFKVIENEEELESMLDAPLERWRIFLHPSQRKLVQLKANGPVRVLGGAGTGKTVVLMHRAQHLATEVFTQTDDRILVTTFTRNLAIDLEMNLRNLCGREFERIVVANLHRWAAQFMRKHGIKYDIIHEWERSPLWEQAIAETGNSDFPLVFYNEEWDRVVQAQDIRDQEGYLLARRVGRGTRLSRRQRATVWETMESYRQLLAGAGKSEWQDVVRETRQYIEKQELRLPYRAILVDEVQDLSPTDLRLLRAMVPEGPNDLFLVGDGHQRIYGQQTRLGRCGINISGRSRRLKMNYRTTEQIRNAAIAVLKGFEIDDLDDGIDSLKGYYSLRQGPKPEIQHFTRENEEARYVVERINKWIGQGHPPHTICIAARTKHQVQDRYAPMLRAAGLDTVIVEVDLASEAQQPGVRVATMHRLKGLEFPHVILAGVQEGQVPPVAHSEAADETSAEDHELQERCLLYVAMTRARDDLVITGFGRSSPLFVTT